MSNWLGDNMQSSSSPRGQRGHDTLPTTHDPYAGASGEGPSTSYTPAYSAKQEQLHRFAGVGVGLSSVFAEHVLSHPCIVLRRQCQVHNNSTSYHMVPITLLPTIFNIQRHQSVTTLWKGIGSTLVVKGIGVAAESAISEFTPLPREVNRHSSLKKIAQHLVLKSMSFLVMTPFYAASLVETVQSEIASERPGVLDCVREGVSRLAAVTTAQTTRLLPVWKLLLPAVVHGLLHYVISALAQYSVVVSIRQDMIEAKPSPSKSGSAERTIYETYYPELLATFTGSLLADTMLYPLETLLHRLLLQGTRTIIDNTDSGLGVVPIITRYEGLTDAVRCVVAEEGLGGLYKGFGALLLQYGVHFAILKLAKYVFERMAAEAASPASTTPLSDLHRMQQMQAQVRGQTQSLPPHAASTATSSPASTSMGHSPMHRPSRRLSQEDWTSPVVFDTRGGKGGW